MWYFRSVCMGWLCNYGSFQLWKTECLSALLELLDAYWTRDDQPESNSAISHPKPVSFACFCVRQCRFFTAEGDNNLQFCKMRCLDSSATSEWEAVAIVSECKNQGLQNHTSNWLVSNLCVAIFGGDDQSSSFEWKVKMIFNIVFLDPQVFFTSYNRIWAPWQ